MIVRSHVAFGGEKIIFIGYEKPWDFKKGSQAFSRKLEQLCSIEFLPSVEMFLDWSQSSRLANIAIEIKQNASNLSQHKFDGPCNLLVGSEKTGLPSELLNRCDTILKIPQFGNVECLNASIAASISMYEFRRLHPMQELEISGSKYIVANETPSSSQISKDW